MVTLTAGHGTSQPWPAVRFAVTRRGSGRVPVPFGRTRADVASPRGWLRDMLFSERDRYQGAALAHQPENLRYYVELADERTDAGLTQIYFIIDLLTGERIHDAGNADTARRFAALDEAWQACDELNFGPEIIRS